MLSETQLDAWAQPGSNASAQATYKSITSALTAWRYAGNRPKIFLQGSYGNSTNIRADSDVDVVALLQGVWFRDLSHLPEWPRPVCGCGSPTAWRSAR